MAIEFRLPALGENVGKGDVVSVLVRVGDLIAVSQPLLELETDKATVEVPSEVEGKIEKVHVSEGDSIEVGQLILTLSEGGAPEESAAGRGSVPAVEVEKPQEARQVEGPVEERGEAPGGAARKGPETAARSTVDFKPRQEAPAASAAGRLVPASPAVRRFAREIGVDVGKVEGSGPKGRISVEDVKSYAKQAAESGSGRTGIVEVTAAPPDPGRFGEISREPFSNVRRATAQHLAHAWLNVPHVTNHDQADVTHLEGLLKKYGPEVESQGGKLTITAIALKIVAAALRKYPKFNASIDMQNQEVVYKHYFHVGVAVDTPRGLLVPVLRDVDRKSVVELSSELKEAAERARMAKLTMAELQGGCFTITNLGGIGGTAFTPIVNFPEVAILGLSRASTQPVFQDGEFRPRRILPLSLSYDHRLIDGADAARFLRWVASAFEDPFLLSLG